MNRKKVFIIISIILIFTLTLSIIFYVYKQNEWKYENSSQYELILKDSLKELDSKNKNVKIKTAVYNELNDPKLIPYIDKTNSKLKRQIDVVITSNDNKTHSVALEIFEFDKKVNVEKIYDYIENKTQFKFDKQNNKLLFINLIGQNEQVIREKIINKLIKYKEVYK